MKRTLALAATIVLVHLSAAADCAYSQSAAARVTPRQAASPAAIAPGFGRIEGRVLGPDSRPVEFARVDYIE